MTCVFTISSMCFSRAKSTYDTFIDEVRWSLSNPILRKNFLQIHQTFGRNSCPSKCMSFKPTYNIFIEWIWRSFPNTVRRKTQFLPPFLIDRHIFYSNWVKGTSLYAVNAMCLFACEKHIFFLKIMTKYKQILLKIHVLLIYHLKRGMWHFYKSSWMKILLSCLDENSLTSSHWAWWILLVNLNKKWITYISL